MGLFGRNTKVSSRTLDMLLNLIKGEKCCKTIKPGREMEKLYIAAGEVLKYVTERGNNPPVYYDGKRTVEIRWRSGDKLGIITLPETRPTWHNEGITNLKLFRKRYEDVRKQEREQERKRRNKQRIRAAAGLAVAGAAAYVAGPPVKAFFFDAPQPMLVHAGNVVFDRGNANYEELIKTDDDGNIWLETGKGKFELMNPDSLYAFSFRSKEPEDEPFFPTYAVANNSYTLWKMFFDTGRTKIPQVGEIQREIYDKLYAWFPHETKIADGKVFPFPYGILKPVPDTLFGYVKVPGRSILFAPNHAAITGVDVIPYRFPKTLIDKQIQEETNPQARNELERIKEMVSTKDIIFSVGGDLQLEAYPNYKIEMPDFTVFTYRGTGRTSYHLPETYVAFSDENSFDGTVIVNRSGTPDIYHKTGDSFLSMVFGLPYFPDYAPSSHVFYVNLTHPVNQGMKTAYQQSTPQPAPQSSPTPGPAATPAASAPGTIYSKSESGQNGNGIYDNSAPSLMQQINDFLSKHTGDGK